MNVSWIGGLLAAADAKPPVGSASRYPVVFAGDLSGHVGGTLPSSPGNR